MEQWLLAIKLVKDLASEFMVEEEEGVD